MLAVDNRSTQKPDIIYLVYPYNLYEHTILSIPPTSPGTHYFSYDIVLDYKNKRLTSQQSCFRSRYYRNIDVLNYIISGVTP